jgi:hypothetical protein
MSWGDEEVPRVTANVFVLREAQLNDRATTKAAALADEADRGARGDAALLDRLIDIARRRFVACDADQARINVRWQPEPLAIIVSTGRHSVSLRRRVRDGLTPVSDRAIGGALDASGG